MNIVILENKQLENTERAIKTENPEKLAIYGTKEEEKQSKITAKYVLNTNNINLLQTTGCKDDCYILLNVVIYFGQTSLNRF